MKVSNSSSLPEGVPGRRRYRGKRLTSPVFAYMTADEKALCEQAAALQRKSLSSWLAEFAVERAGEELRLFNLGASAQKPPRKGGKPRN